MPFLASANETRTTAAVDKGSPPSRNPVRTIKNALQQKNLRMFVRPARELEAVKD